MPTKVTAFFQDGAVFRWICPCCHKQNHIRVIGNGDCLGDKCDCELKDARHLQCKIKIGSHEITYLSPDFRETGEANLYQ